MGIFETPLHVTRIDHICDECPSEYMGTLADGRFIFFHFRGGELYLGIGATREEAVRTQKFYGAIGTNEVNGTLDYVDLCRMFAGMITFPNECGDEPVIECANHVRKMDRCAYRVQEWEEVAA